MNPIVSYVSSITTKLVVNCDLSSALTLIRDGAEKDRILEMRAVVDKDHDQYSTLKSKLPAHIFSGRFIGGHSIQNLVEYNRVMTLDIDKLSSEEITRVRNVLKKDPHVYSFWLSPSGKGYKGLVKLDYGEIVLNDYTYWHREAFLQLASYFKNSYGIELDNHCKDVPRLCFLSYDPDLYVNETASPFIIQPINEVKESTAASKVVRAKKAALNYIGKTYNNQISGRNQAGDRKTICSIIRYLEKRKISITTSYDEWFSVAMAIVTTFNYDIGKEYYLRLCRLDGNKHDEEASISMLQYCYEHSNFNITLGTIIYYSQRKGYVFNYRAVPKSS